MTSELEKKIEQLTKGIELNPKDDAAHYNRGNALNGLGRKEEAIKDYTKAIELNPKLDAAYCNRGIALNGLGRKEEAIEDYTKAIELNPKLDAAYYNRGIALNCLGRKEEAIKNYTEAIELNPKRDEAYYNRGIILNDLGRKEEAIENYTIAIELNPKFDSAYYNRGNALNSLGREEEAIKDYTKAIELNPKRDEAYYNRGIVLNGLGRKEEAIKDYLKALEMQPDHPLYMSSLGNFYYVQNEKAKAKTCFSKAILQLQNQKIKTYNISENNIKFIKSKIQLIEQIEDIIEETQILVRLKTLPQQQQQQFEKELINIKGQIDREVIKPSIENSNIKEIEQIYLELKQLKEKFSQLEQQLVQKDEQIDQLQKDFKEIISQDQVIIQKELDSLQKNRNQFLYYLSLYWRLQLYLQACVQISTDLFMTNNDAVIETTNERVAQVVTKVGKSVAESLPIPGLSSAFNLVDQALEFYKKRKFQERVQRLVNLIKIKSTGQQELEREIKFAVISLAKQLPENLQIEERPQNIYQYVKSIFEFDYNDGIKEAKNPYWIQGIYDVITILHYLEHNSGTIQDDSETKLRDFIVYGAKQMIQNVERKPEVASQEGCSSFCQIQ